MRIHNNFMLLLIVFMCHISCVTVNTAGGSSSTDNGRILGKIYSENGTTVSSVQVTLMPHDNDPFCDSSVVIIDTTDTTGSYEFNNLSEGIYNIEAVALHNRMRAIMCAINVDSSINYMPAVSLLRPAAITINLENNLSDMKSYVYVPGTSLYSIVNNGVAFIDSVPAGIIPALIYAKMDEPAKKHTIKKYLTMTSGASKVIADYSAWKYSKRVFLNTTAEGAGISEMVKEFPVLIRLSKENFDFEQSLIDGGDLRFKKSDDTPLPYEIERWDRDNKNAEIWVKVDTVYGNDSSQYFTMYWGNPDVSSESNGSVTFDTSCGFQGVWHMAGEGSEYAFDATANRYHGTPNNMTESSAVEGAIGGARGFDGMSSYISMQGTAESRLNFPEDGYYSMSLWVYADAIDSIYHAIAGKGHEQYYMQLKCLKGNKGTWEFVEFQDKNGWEYTEDTTPPGPGAKQWLYLAAVREGNSQTFYINGKKIVKETSMMTGAYNRNTTDNFNIGSYGRTVTIPYQQGWSYFHGKIDEVRVSSVSLSDDWIRLCYMNQKAQDALVSF